MREARGDDSSPPEAFTPTSNYREIMKTIQKFAFALAAVAFAAGAQAAPFTFEGLPTDSEALTYTYSATTAGTGMLTFTLYGFNSLDGANGYEDDFTVTAAGATKPLFDGTFNLGGGGSSVVYWEPTGTHITGTTSSTAITWAGGELTFSIPVALAAGKNTFDFDYTSVKGGFQGVSDEGWYVDSPNVTPVPEPTSMALLLAGFGIVGGLARRRGARKA